MGVRIFDLEITIYFKTPGDDYCTLVGTYVGQPFKTHMSYGVMINNKSQRVMLECQNYCPQAEGL